MSLLSMTLLLAFVALAVDVGVLFRARRNLQIVADAAATAGAVDYYKNVSTSSARTAAKSAVSSNQLTVSSGNWSTTCPATAPSGAAASFACVSVPASTGAHTGTGSVEVQITQPNPTTFMGYFGFNPVNVAVRAVAASVAGVACIYVNKTYAVQGSATLVGIDPATGKQGKACGVYVGGDVDVTGSGNTIDAQYVEVNGTLVSHGGNTIHPAPLITGVPPQSPAKPLMATPPSIPSGCSMPPGTTMTAGKGKNPTTYTATLTGPISAGCFGFTDPPPANSILNLTISNATFGTGLYQFNLGTGGTLTLGAGNCNSGYCTGTAPPDGSAGVTLELNTGNFAASGNQNLYSPSDGSSDPENGILLWAPATNTGTACLQFGSSTGNFSGYIDTPQMTVGLHDQGGFALVTGLVVGNLCQGNGVGSTVCKSFNCTGPSTLYVKNYNQSYASGPNRSIALVE
jgi:hypothetical protein